MPTTPDREALRALFDEAVQQITAARSNKLTGEFYARTGDAVFERGCLALFDTLSDTRRVHTISAPVGGGKTSYSLAFMLAVTRYAEANPDAPYGCVFVVDEITKADNAYRELNALLPGQVAVWTTEHDPKCRKRDKASSDTPTFTQTELRRYPIIVVTHKFYLGNNGHNARAIVRDGQSSQRALTIVDEQPAEVEPIEILLSEAQHVREAVQEAHPQYKEHLDNLLHFMEVYSYKPANKLYRPGVDLSRQLVADELAWFNTTEAAKAARRASGVPGADRLFAFARAMVLGFGWITTGAQFVRFTAYQSKLVVNVSAGTMLLDATADIDGVSQVVTWRADAEVPKASYDNLEIIHVPQHTRVRLSEYLKKASNQRAYAEHMVETIREHMLPGERGLVVCKKALIDAERVPQWPEGDPRYQTPELYTKGYGWEIDGRHLCLINWGTGVGSNDWKDADVVFLFDEYFIPRRTAAAITQGLREHRADEGDLASMTTMSSKARGVDAIADGHRLRHTKQLALRGKGRFYDENGVCGKQRLVISSGRKSFTVHVKRLFPGANIRLTGADTEDSTWTDRVITELSRINLPDRISTNMLGQKLGKPWREICRNVDTNTLEGAGWCYRPKQGRGGGHFERSKPDISLAA